MVDLLKKRWVQYVLGGLLLFVAGLLVGSLVFKEAPIPPERPDRVVLNADDADVAKVIPLTAADAVSCSPACCSSRSFPAERRKTVG